MNKQYKELFNSGKWMVRTSDNGKSYNGFQWQPKGEWTVAPDWNTVPRCGNGLHGQNKDYHGYFQISGVRLELCETSDNLVSIGDDKVKCQKAKIIAIDEEIPLEFLEAIGLKFKGKPSLKALTSVGGYLSIHSNVKLPALTSVGGDKGRFINGAFVKEEK